MRKPHASRRKPIDLYGLHGSGITSEILSRLGPELIKLLPALLGKSASEVGDFLSKKVKKILGNGIDPHTIQPPDRLIGSGNRLSGGSGSLPGQIMYGNGMNLDTGVGHIMMKQAKKKK